MDISRRVRAAVGIAVGVALVGLGALFAYIGLDSADKLSSVLGALTALAGFPLALYGAIQARPQSTPSNLPDQELAGRAAAQLRVIFDRPAFTETCMMELSLKHLNQAIDDTLTALNTGKLYSRTGNLLVADFIPVTETPLPDLEPMFSSRTDWEEFKRFASAQLVKLRRLTGLFVEEIRRIYPDHRHHNVFFTMVAPAIHTAELQVVRGLFALMDQIDHERNVLIIEVNHRLSEVGLQELPLIELSSDYHRREEGLE
ncbi:hypothetical protein ABGB12_06690 [Actinocorallia sp. B10E7]|uniref:hypothetical protein n=1 Tax=Actinocorallia sp. B10E7 TaxID=3153558 RepID=UPI00325C6A86